MSVVVKNISKIYGKQKAVDDLSFEAHEGEVLGLLGPNGAGKTTTMKILTCFLPPTSGDAIVCGKSIFDDQQHVRRSIGYLPEHNPLYLDMYVRESLGMVADIFKVSNKEERIDEVIEMTGLSLEQNKQLQALSKGYRQRVGLAQALIHDPEVLILDEPTSGLDPNQLAEIRSLIKKLGRDKTIIFSSHILQEVTALCDRVIILNNGKLVANSNIDQLSNEKRNEDLIKIEFLNNIDLKTLKAAFPESRINELKNNLFEIRTTKSNDLRIDLFDFAVANKNKILAMSREQISVEELFQQLTKEEA